MKLSTEVRVNLLCVAFVAINGVAGAVAAAAEPPTTGKEAYERGCASCHSAATSGAPLIGDHAAWGLRIAQGRMTLYRHTILGKGEMPARGGTDWPDATIRLAVDYMVSLNK
jgi:cytochrome c5